MGWASLPALVYFTRLGSAIEGLKDTEVLPIVVQQGRILVSHDRKTMSSEFAEFITNAQSAGVIIVSRKLQIETIIQELLLIWAVSSAEEWVDRIAKLPL